MSTSTNPKKNTIHIETEIDETLTLEDIKNDLTKCNRMIKRADQKIKKYKLKLNIERHSSPKEKNLLQKGLELFNLTSKWSSKV